MSKSIKELILLKEELQSELIIKKVEAYAVGRDLEILNAEIDEKHDGDLVEIENKTKILASYYFEIDNIATSIQSINKKLLKYAS